MSIYDKPPRYRSYLLTFWEERSQDPDTPVVWRFRLEDPRTERRRGFEEFEEMITFLRSELVGSGQWQHNRSRNTGVTNTQCGCDPVPAFPRQ